MPFGFGPAVVEPSKNVIFAFQAKVPTRPYAVFIPAQDAQYFSVIDMRVGMVGFFSSEPIPALLFSWSCRHEDCASSAKLMLACIEQSCRDGLGAGEDHAGLDIREHVGFDTAATGVPLMITLENTSSEPREVQGAWLTTVLDGVEGSMHPLRPRGPL